MLGLILRLILRLIQPIYCKHPYLYANMLFLYISSFCIGGRQERKRPTLEASHCNRRAVVAGKGFATTTTLASRRTPADGPTTSLSGQTKENGVTSFSALIEGDDLKKIHTRHIPTRRRGPDIDNLLWLQSRGMCSSWTYCCFSNAKK
ncbi:uncharacterized protein F5Z01DRAFT_644978 [Emericellopsis atlantica]|uniref:Uncharacterized protein n=1 Tax=Emericellopsis atlantica TaxID=2614577 RepID=A0A9P7ZTG2_9HYPO|nr:uncharacterized protein F5Z01DRAFT_644978 [Emericellopsis atlantica]KAG9258049.1 hypothetical protein F5Z01DRAFT_644978 [Emericellopsis atlantica]